MKKKRILLVALFLGLVVGVFQFNLQRTSTQVAYYQDACLSIGGCCPGEGKNDPVKGALCPYEEEGVQVVGFPFTTASYNEGSGILLVNFLLISLGLPILVLVLMKLKDNIKHKQ